MLRLNLPSRRPIVFSEYWLFIPLALLFNIYILRSEYKERELKKQKEQALADQQRLVEQIEKLKADRRRKEKIYYFATNNLLALLNLRGGEQLEKVIAQTAETFIHTMEYRNCLLERGLRVIDNNRIRELVYKQFSHKAIHGVVYATRSLICYMANRYGKTAPIIPFLPIRAHRLLEVLDVSSGAVAAKKLGSALSIVGGLRQLLVADTLTGSIGGLLAGIFGVCLDYNIIDDGFIEIPSVAVDLPMGQIRRRIASVPEVVSVDIDDNKIVMPTFSNSDYPRECVLFDQQMFNSRCRNLRPTEISQISAGAGMRYNDVANLQDGTWVRMAEFNDRVEIEPWIPKASCTQNCESDCVFFTTDHTEYTCKYTCTKSCTYSTPPAIKAAVPKMTEPRGYLRGSMKVEPATIADKIVEPVTIADKIVEPATIADKIVETTRLSKATEPRLYLRGSVKRSKQCNNFLEKFKDSANVPVSEQWDANLSWKTSKITERCTAMKALASNLDDEL